MFAYWKIRQSRVDDEWINLRNTISKEIAYKATEFIGEYAAADMIEETGIGKQAVDRIYVKYRDGLPMAAGMRKALPNVDVRYIISQEKQQGEDHIPISFWDPWDGYSNEIVWFADPMNATGHTAIESMRFIYKHFAFDTILLSHVAANRTGIDNIQTKITDFNIDGFMNYAFLSSNLRTGNGYMLDGLELIPDFGDKIYGTLGEDYSTQQIQEDLKNLLGTSVGEVEIVKSAILHLLQLRGREEYMVKRKASWATAKWIKAVLFWYKYLRNIPFNIDSKEQIIQLLSDLTDRGFLKIENRPWKRRFARIYSLTEEGLRYTSSVYLPILVEKGIARPIQKDFDFLVYLNQREISKLIDESLRTE
jgi:uracil phosphoribosyltransferase